MALGTVTLGNLPVSRLILGGNPFSTFSHQSPDRDREMREYYTAARIKETFRQAEAAGVTTFIGRTDNHIIRVLQEYWDEGGALQWVAQTASELKTIGAGAGRAIAFGAKACFAHGGCVDYALANSQEQEVLDAIAQIKAAGLPAGVAGHHPRVFEWAEANLDCDFYMCSYYNPSERARHAAHDPTCQERFHDDDRALMVETIAGLTRPVIHYKVFAAGRKRPEETFPFVARHLRPGDAVCVGVFTKDDPDMIARNVASLERALAEVRKA